MPAGVATAFATVVAYAGGQPGAWVFGVLAAAQVPSLASAHNWVHGIRSRARGASTAQPCRQRTDHVNPHVNVRVACCRTVALPIVQSLFVPQPRSLHLPTTVRSGGHGGHGGHRVTAADNTCLWLARMIVCSSTRDRILRSSGRRAAGIRGV